MEQGKNILNLETERNPQSAYTIRKGERSDLKWIRRIELEALASLEDQTLFAIEDEAFAERHLEKEGFILICQVDGEPAAYLMVRLPGQAEDNLGRDAGVPADQLDQVAHMESVVVTERFRGRGIQKILLDRAEQEAIRRGYKLSMATVAPGNPASLRSFLALGYREVARKEKYGGLERCILLKKIG